MELNASNFEEFIGSEGVVMVDFWKEDCRPCKMLGMALERVSTRNPEVKIGKIQLEEVGTEFFAEHKVQSTPTLIFYKDGEEITRQIGFNDVMTIAKVIDANS